MAAFVCNVKFVDANACHSTYFFYLAPFQWTVYGTMMADKKNQINICQSLSRVFLSSDFWNKVSEAAVCVFVSPWIRTLLVQWMMVVHEYVWICYLNWDYDWQGLFPSLSIYLSISHAFDSFPICDVNPHSPWKHGDPQPPPRHPSLVGPNTVSSKSQSESIRER